MSLYIKGIDMPKDRALIIRISPNGGVLKVLEYEPVFIETKAEAVEIPTPHGRLIDADELADIVDGTDWYHINRKGELVNGAGVEDEALYKADDILTSVNNAPTIIEAEPKEKLHCKDCKHYAKEGNDWGRCYQYHTAVNETYSCEEGR